MALSSKRPGPEVTAAEGLTFYAQRFTEFICAHLEIRGNIKRKCFYYRIPPD
jgi:hypothetical protein